MSIFIFFLVLFVFILVFICYLTHRNHSYLPEIPKPPCNLLFGHMLKLSNPTAILDKFTEYSIKYGGMMRLYIPPGRPSVLITDSKILQQLMTSNQTLNKSRSYNFTREWLGKGLVLNGGTEWKERRRLLNPCFGSVNVLKGYLKIFDKHGDILIEKMLTKVENKNLDIFPLFKMFTMDIICETAMGVSINSQKNENLSYLNSIHKMCSIVFWRIVVPWKTWESTFKLTNDYREQLKALEVVNSFFDKMILDRIKKNKDVDATKKQLSESQDVEETDTTKMFIDLLFKAAENGERLTLKDIKDETNTFIFAGHDTTATALSFTLYTLARHPDVQDKVLAEQKQIFGDLTKPVKSTYSDLQQMKYLEMAIKETLRLYPPLPFIARILSENVKLGNGIILPKTLNVLFFIYGCHRNPQYFPEPTKFLPERFENSDIGIFSYLPFSAGYRNCIGQKFAMLQLKCCISKIIRNFELYPSIPEYEIELIPTIILFAKNGIRISLKRRTYE